MTKPQILSEYLAVLICFIMLLTGCTFTTTKIKDPVINDMNQLQKELVSLVIAENINLAGKEITKNNRATSELEISITNGQNIPKSDDERYFLGKLIAKMVKTHLRDSSQFDFYKVLFVSKGEDGVTKHNWTDYKFNAQELAATDLIIGKRLNSENGYVNGGSIFTLEDSEVVCVIRDFTFIDTFDVTIRIYKLFEDNQEMMGESHVKDIPYDNYLCHRMNVKEFYNAYGPGKYKFEVLSQDTIIASKNFEFK